MVLMALVNCCMFKETRRSLRAPDTCGSRFAGGMLALSTAPAMDLAAVLSSPSCLTSFTMVCTFPRSAAHLLSNAFLAAWALLIGVPAGVLAVLPPTMLTLPVAAAAADAIVGYSTPQSGPRGEEGQQNFTVQCDASCCLHGNL